MSEEREIYVAAAKLDRDEQREDFLTQVCHDRPAMKTRIRHLLRAKTLGKSPLARVVSDNLAVNLGEPTDVATAGERDDCGTPPLPKLKRYELLKEIGHGGMGTVYLAQQTEPIERQVAVKVINPGMNSREVLSRFEAERQTLANMDHPGIARVLDGGQTESGLPFFAMELVRGQSITAFCRDHRLTLRQRIELFARVCHAVQHAHQKGIIHRDLKPGNILVASEDQQPIAKVIDFGVAKALDRGRHGETALTQFPSFIGTPRYVSPEQARPTESDIDTRTDVYSLGVVLYELLTGTTPCDETTLPASGNDDSRSPDVDFRPERPSSRLQRALPASDRDDHQTRTLAEAGQCPSDLRRELDWIVLKCLETDRERRYESAKSLADDLQRYLDGDTVEACPPRLGYRFGKWYARNRVAVAAAGLLFLTLGFIAAISLWQVRQVRQAWLASTERERQVTHLLHANQLQSAVRAFRESNFKAMPDLLRRGDPSGRSDRGKQGATYLHRLLLDLAEPPYDEEILLPYEVADLVCHDGSASAWVSDVEGNIYRLPLDSPWDDTKAGMIDPIASLGGSADAIAVSPDGNRLAIGSGSEVSIWTVDETPTLVQKVVVGSNGVETVVWSSDGSYLAVGSRYEGVWVGRADGRELFRVENDHRHESLVFRPDGRQLIVPTRLGFDYYSMPDGRRVRSIRQDGSDPNPRELLLVGAEGEWLLTCDRSLQTGFVHDSAAGQPIGEVTLGSSYPQSSIAFSDGRSLALVYPNGLLQILRLRRSRGSGVSGETIAEFNIGDPGDVFDENADLRVGVSPNGETLITAGPGRRLRRWSMGRVLPTQLRHPPTTVHAAYPTGPDRLTMFFARPESPETIGGDRAITIGIAGKCNAPPGELIDMPVNGFSDHVSRQGWIACAGPNHVTIYDMNRGRVLKRLMPGLMRAPDVRISVDGNAVAVGGGYTGGLKIWTTDDDWRSAHCVLEEPAHTKGVLCFDTHMDRTTLLYGESEKRVVELSLHDRSRRILQVKSTRLYTSSTVDSRQRLLFIGTRDAIEIVDLAGRGRDFSFDQLSEVKGLMLLPDQQVLLSGHNDGRIQAWHLPTRQALGTLIEPRVGVGVPYRFHVFPSCHRLLINYRNDDQVSPLIVGTDRIPQH